MYFVHFYWPKGLYMDRRVMFNRGESLISFLNPVMHLDFTLVTLEWHQANQSCAFEYAGSMPKLEIAQVKLFNKVSRSNGTLDINLVPP